MTAATHLVPGASFDDEQLLQRRRTLGASEVPAVLGLDRYKSPLDIYLQKTGRAPAFAGNEHTEWGLRMEPVIRQKVAETLGVSIDLPGSLIHPEHEWVSATPDGLLIHDGHPSVLEIKNKGERQAIYWGVAGTDEVPLDVLSQVYWQLFTTGLHRAVVAVLFGKSDFRLYFVQRDQETAERIYQRCAEFWQAHIIGGIEPEIGSGEPTAEYLKRKFAAHGETLREATRIEDALIAELKTVRADQKEMETIESGIVNKLMAAIGADAGIQGRQGRITWKAPKPTFTTDYKALIESLAIPSETVSRFTHEKANSRRFLATFPKEG